MRAIYSFFCFGLYELVIFLAVTPYFTAECNKLTGFVQNREIFCYGLYELVIFLAVTPHFTAEYNKLTGFL